MQQTKILIGLGCLVVGLVAGVAIGDRWGWPFADRGVPTHASDLLIDETDPELSQKLPKDTGRACGNNATEVGFYYDASGNRYLGCRDNRTGIVNLIPYP